MLYVTKELIREQLPIELALGLLGIEVREDGYAVCPFHDDRNPSLGTYLGDDDVERWKCWPCDRGGDVIDLVRGVEGLAFPDAVRRCGELMSQAPRNYQRVKKRRHAPPDLDTWAGEINQAQERLTGKYRDEWGWGFDEAANLVMPHWNEAGTLTGVKVRSSDGRRWSWGGSTWPSLYGAWRPRNSQRTLLCEGETDAVWADIAFAGGGSPHVLALPAGWNYFRAEWVRRLPEGGTVYLAFDGDEWGDEACERWSRALHATGRRAMIIGVPRGQDLRSWEPELPTLFDSAEPHPCELVRW